MSLFVDRSPGVDSGSVTTDLFTISWNDGNLGQGADTTITGVLAGITSIPAAPVTYTPSVSTGQASADRLFELVNKGSGDGLAWANPIVITPLAGGIDPYSGLDVTGNGYTYVDTGPTPNVIHVVYDTSQANGQGLALFDIDGNAIQAPNAVILYHELSHAFHSAINQSPFPQSACPGNTSDEPAAEIDENVLRTQLGLCLRDVCNHNGELGWGKACGGRATPDGPPLTDGSAPPEDDGGCFIVTAATGSAQAPEIFRLRAIRDRLAARSKIGKDLIAAIYDEYWRFSPAIADEIAASPEARAAVRQFVVAPLFAWYELAEALAFAGDVDRATKAVLRACPAELAAPTTVVLSLAASGAADASTMPGFHLLADAVSKVAARPLAAWALMRPLIKVWECAASGDRAADALAVAIGDWLAAAPLAALRPPPMRSLDRELHELAGFLAFAPDARRALGARLAEAWPSTSPAVARCGFL